MKFDVIRASKEVLAGVVKNLVQVAGFVFNEYTTFVVYHKSYKPPFLVYPQRERVVLNG
jgi:hypothetical protein